MRLLLDECVPRPLRLEMPEHDVQHVVDMGWSSKRNGELLQLMQAHGFAGFVTVDQNLAFQQNVQRSGLAVIVLVARTNRLKDLQALVPALRAALDRARPGELHRVSG